MKVPISYDISNSRGFFGVLMGNDTPEPLPQHYWWGGCRELFHDRLGKCNKKSFFFVIPNKEKFIDFLRHVEDCLFIPYTEIEDTESSNVFYITPSPFWISAPMRLNFFSIVIKEGVAYSEGYWKDHLLKSKYLIHNTFAAEVFLSGRTCYLGSSNQWQFFFDKQTEFSTLTYLKKEGEIKSTKESILLIFHKIIGLFR